jgi:peptidoglycan hydrolase-like protein with peptidoglycan-binding domain
MTLGTVLTNCVRGIGHPSPRSPAIRRPSRLAACVLASGLIALAAGGVEAQSSSTVVSVTSETAVATTTANWRPTGDQTSGVQRRLKDLGFDPGPLDGSIGPRTARAIRAYQRSIGLVPDGKLTRELYDRITGASPEPAAEAPVPAVDPNPALVAIPFSQADCGEIWMWRFVDSFGSSFELSLRSDGTVEGPTSPGQWSWRTQDEGVEIVYDNGMGQRVTRIGYLQGDDRMAGEATDSTGRVWDWSAERTVIPAESKFDCQAGGSAP